MNNESLPPTLLIVEDENIIALDIQNTLKNLGYLRTFIVSTGEEAIRKVLEIKPSLVLMDIVLRDGIDGIEAAKKIQTIAPVPIVYLTAYADEATLGRAKLTAPYGYVLKPFSERELHIAIEIALYKSRMEQNLRENEAKYRDIVELAPVGILTADAEGIVMSCNNTFCEQSGFAKHEIIGKHFTALPTICREDLPTYLSMLRRSLKGRGKKPCETKWRHKNGSMRVGEVLVSVMRTHGEITGLQAVVRDTTDRKRMERVQAVLYEISKAVDRIDSMPKLFRFIHQRLGGILDVTNFFIALYDQVRDELSFPYFVDEKVHLQRSPAERTPTAYVIKRNLPLLLTGNDRPRPIEISRLKEHGTPSKAWLGVPLRIGGKAIGAMVAQSYADATHYSKSDLKVLEIVSGPVAAAIHRRQSQAEIERRLELERLLARLAEQFVKTEAVDAAVKVSVATIGRLLSADRVLFFEYRRPKDVWTATYQWHRRGLRGLGRLVNNLPSRKYQWWIRMMRRRPYFMVSDVAVLPALAGSAKEELSKHDVRCLLVVPVSLEGKLFGALALLSHDAQRAWPKDDLVLMQAVGETIAAGLAKHSYHQQLQTALTALTAERQKLEELAKNTIALQERERLSIASEIHDDILQGLAAILYFLQMLDTNALDPTVQEKKKQLIDVVHNSIERARKLISAIEPIREPEIGLTQAIRRVIDHGFADQSINVRCSFPKKVPLLNFTLKANVLRIVQEALLNIRKHAHAKNVDVRLTTRLGRLVLEVHDDGVGFDPKALKPRVVGRFGLLTMQGRAQLMGGSLTIHGKPGRGTVINANLPLSQGVEHEENQNPVGR